MMLGAIPYLAMNPHLDAATFQRLVEDIEVAHGALVAQAIEGLETLGTALSTVAPAQRREALSRYISVVLPLLLL